MRLVSICMLAVACGNSAPRSNDAPVAVDAARPRDASATCGPHSCGSGVCCIVYSAGGNYEGSLCESAGTTCNIDCDPADGACTLGNGETGVCKQTRLSLNDSTLWNVCSPP
jgi:hypothetical protein